MPSTLMALSPLDGRYASKADALRPFLSEFGLVRFRVKVEVEWLLALAEAKLPGLPPITDDAAGFMRGLFDGFGEADAEAVKAIERRTNHDVKAVEYWLASKMDAWPALRPFLHFACTSEDINNTSHALMLAGARDAVLLPAIDRLLAKLRELAAAHADRPMLSRTHGQTASPTTLGKEVGNVAMRLARAKERIAKVELPAKLNGAVGNYNAHVAACPEVDWPQLARRVVEERLGLVFNTHTTQIEPHDGIAELFDAIRASNVILVDWARDAWGYISLGYFRQRPVEGEVGSSTMPHKVNPIDFENGEGNYGVANALLSHMSEKLPVSRFQRDLTDSTVLRNMGVALGHTLVAHESLLKGMGKLDVDAAAIDADLDAAWEVLGEAVQTVLRRHGVADAYEQLKALTRGRPITQEVLHAFVREAPLPEADRARLLALEPRTYVGLAARLARDAAGTVS